MNELPQLYLITGASNTQTDFLKRLEIHLMNGIKLVQLRAKTLSTESYKSLALKAIELGKKYNAKIILNAEITLFEETQADGLHLPSKKLMELSERPLPKHKLISASCHNEEELIYAKNIGIDFICLSPVLPTASHPETQPLGWNRFRELCKTIELPIYALGGLTPNDLDLAVSYGAHGIAAIRSLW